MMVVNALMLPLLLLSLILGHFLEPKINASTLNREDKYNSSLPDSLGFATVKLNRGSVTTELPTWQGLGQDAQPLCSNKLLAIYTHCAAHQINLAVVSA